MSGNMQWLLEIKADDKNSLEKVLRELRSVGNAGVDVEKTFKRVFSKGAAGEQIETIIRGYRVLAKVSQEAHGHMTRSLGATSNQELRSGIIGVRTLKEGTKNYIQTLKEQAKAQRELHAINRGMHKKDFMGEQQLGSAQDSIREARARDAEQKRVTNAKNMAEAMMQQVRDRNKHMEGVYKAADQARKVAEEQRLTNAKTMGDAMLQQVKDKQAQVKRHVEEGVKDRKFKEKELTGILLGEMKNRQVALGHHVRQTIAAKKEAEKTAAQLRMARNRDSEFGVTEGSFGSRAHVLGGKLGFDRDGSAKSLAHSAVIEFSKARAAHANYIHAIEHGDREAARSNKAFRDSFVRNANAMARAAENSVNKQIRDNERLSKSHHSLMGKLHRLRFDMHTLMSTFTGMGMFHGLFGAIEGAGHKMYEMLKSSVEFNDQIQKAGIIFKSLGVADLHKPIYELENSKDPKERARLAQSEQFSTRMIDMIRVESARTGISFAELMKMAAGQTPHMINRLGKGPSETMANHQETIVGNMKKMIDLSAVLKMIGQHSGKGDQFRHTAFSLFEAMSGSEGTKGKAAGAAAFRSMRQFLGYVPTKPEMTAMTAAAEHHDVSKFVKLLEQFLAKSGVTEQKINDLMKGTVDSNINSIKASLKGIGGIFSEPTWKAALDFFRTLNLYFADVSAYAPFKAFMKETGEMFAGWLKDSVAERVYKFFEFLESKDGAKFAKELRTDFADLGSILDGLTEDFVQFVAGFAGKDVHAKNWSELGDALKDLAPTLKELGGLTRYVVEALKWLIADSIKLEYWVMRVGDALRSTFGFYVFPEIWKTELKWLLSIFNKIATAVGKIKMPEFHLPSLPGSGADDADPTKPKTAGKPAEPVAPKRQGQGGKSASIESDVQTAYGDSDGHTFNISTLVVNGVKDPNGLANGISDGAGRMTGINMDSVQAAIPRG